MNTTNVQTEWFRELIEINNKIIEASTKPVNERDWSFYIGCLQSHIYNYKYFNQPEQSKSSPLTPFCESLRLLRDLADLQNGPPLEQYGKEWVQTMDEVYTFLKFNEAPKPEQSSELDLEELNKWIFRKYIYNPSTDMYHGASNMTSITPFSEVLKAFQNREK